MNLYSYSTVTDYHEPPTTPLRHATADDEGLIEHLQGVMAYAADVTAASTGGEVTAELIEIIEHIRRTKHVVIFDAERPDGLSSWATDANAIFLSEDGEFIDAAAVPHPAVPLPAVPHPVVPHPADAVERAARIRGWLAERGLDVGKELPVAPGVEEMEMRPAEDVVKRILALTVTAEAGRTYLAGDAAPIEAMRKFFPVAFDNLTPAEQEFLARFDDDGRAPQDARDQAIRIGWQVEGAVILAYALGIMDLPATAVGREKPIPAQLIESDPRVLVRGLGKMGQEAVLEKATGFRDAAAIADAHEYICCLRRLVEQGDVPNPQTARVINEWYRALAWLLTPRSTWEE